MRLDIAPEHVQFLALFFLSFPAFVLDSIVVLNFTLPFSPLELSMLIFTALHLLALVPMPLFFLGPLPSGLLLSLFFVLDLVLNFLVVPLLLKLPLLENDGVFLFLELPFFPKELMSHRFLVPFATNGYHGGRIQGTVGEVEV